MIDTRTNKKLLSIFQSGKLNLSAFERLSGVKQTKIKDVIRGKSAFNEDDLIAIRKSLNLIRIEAKKFVDTWNRKEIFNDRDLSAFKEFLKENREIVVMHVFPRQKKLIDFRNGKPVAMSHSDVRDAMKNLAVFILETSIPEK